MKQTIGILLIALGVAVITAALFWPSPTATAQSPLHPSVRLLDSEGKSVLETGQPVSATKTCGTCHNTDFITEHSDHSPRIFGGTEINCFMCHLDNPDNAARIAALSSGNAEWATTATIPNVIDENYSYLIDSDIELGIQDPTIENCGQCHGAVHTDLSVPFTYDVCATSGNWATLMTGQVFSAQPIAQSGLNIKDKNSLAYPWDIHAARVVECVGCHYSQNNPTQTIKDSDLEHLVYDPRRLDFGEYLIRPSHHLEQNECTTCHEADHDWLPYQERHLDVLACETCHIPKLYAPAAASIDYTVVTATGQPIQNCRGMNESEALPLLSGYEPVLLQVDDQLVPHNLVTRWRWMTGDERVPTQLVQQAYLNKDDYLPEVVEIFDSNGDGQLNITELVLDTPDKVELIKANLIKLGVEDPYIVGEVSPYRISHGVTEYATRECETCHSEDSRVSQAILLAQHPPTGIMPTFSGFDGDIVSRDGALYFEPRREGLYVLGHDNVSWVDWLGLTMLFGTMAGVSAHALLRILSARQNRSKPKHHEVEQVYMYSVYERQWHWLQAALIFGLMFTGLVIHRPDNFGMFSFRGIVLVHNALALVLVVNAALAFFYHFVSGEIQQFLPRPRGYFDQMAQQFVYYTRGIFRGEPHPFEKTRNRKLNPIQQLTYFIILNVILPLQVISGVLLWGAQRWPTAAELVGGLPWMATVHAICAWSFASFILIHVYMTTTGHTPTAAIRAMLTGWDEVEVHHHKNKGNDIFPETEAISTGD
ncbi:MAG: hypothetical protein CUN55_11835 [Phototrophicales bacterium]|nr:MAG: hypothetical protein CUN55_11835 [Phototrophicales bacterium]